MEGTEAKKEISSKEEGIKKRSKNLRLFQKGQSGNPNGRPKGSVSVTEAIKRKLLEVFPPDKEFTNKEKKRYLDILVDKIMENAIKNGDARSQKDIWAYMDGHPKATIDIGADKDSLGELTEFFRSIASKKK